MSRRNCIPSYRLHRQSGQAIVTLSDGSGNRRDVLLGKHNTPESRAEYARVIAEWETRDRRLTIGKKLPDLLITELILAYYQYAEGYYRKNDKPTMQLARVKIALRPVQQLYSHTAAAAFGPLALKAVREQMMRMPCSRCAGIGHEEKPADAPKDFQPAPCLRCKGAKVRPWTRGYINASVGCIKRMFKWAVSEELLPASVYEALRTVDGLRKNRTAARETKRIRPVPDADVERTLPELLPQVQAMVKLQRFTAMRPCEVVAIRPADVDRSVNPWLYRVVPEVNKTDHHESRRLVFLGPRAQEVLAPYLLREPEAFCFSPREAVEKMLRDQGRPIRHRKNRAPGDRYTVPSYDRAISKACKRARVPHWHPNQLRHNQATDIRRAAGLDAARAVLGHTSPAITEVYAELDGNKAAEIIAKLG